MSRLLDPAFEVARRLESLPAARLSEVARAFGKRVLADGLYVLREAGGGSFKPTPIPPLLTPLLPDPAAAAAARTLLACVVRTGRAFLSGAVPPAFDLFAGLTPLEVEAIRGNWQHTERVAHSRVDYLRDPGGRLRALEVNATIPAMAGYSDIVARAWVREVAPALGASADALSAALDALPSNVDDLRRSLLAHASEAGAGGQGRWALLARANDPQDGELAWIGARFCDAGLEAVRATPETYFEGAPYDLVYRHLFTRRIVPGHPLEAVYREPRKNHLWNPVNAHLEVKGMLAVVHAAAFDPDMARAFGHSEEEMATVRDVLAWTRILAPGASVDLAGDPVPDLPAWAAAHPGELILKRSWDYGGRSVFMEEDFENSRATERLTAVTGRSLGSWEALVRFASTDPAGAWVVQERIRPGRSRHLRVLDGSPEWSELTTDVSAFTGHGASFTPSGLTARASSTPVVNIVAGGGMAPVIPEELLRTLLEGAG